LADFEIIGVSLPYETLYTNFLNLLDLSGIPLYSEARDLIPPAGDRWWSGGLTTRNLSRHLWMQS
jgi:hypothetical protein